MFNNKKVLVFGTGISGIAAVGLLQTTEADIILYNSNSNIGKTSIRKKLPDDFNGEIILGELNKDIMEHIDLVVLSPGVAIDNDTINKLRGLNIPIWGEVELAYAFEKGRVIAITGTNGKTTTTALVGEIFRTYFEKVFVVGNIGIPYTGVVLDSTDKSVTVAEISSFQLETLHQFKPYISAILNISPDHLDRHYTMDNYVRTKINIAKNQGQEDICILNYDDVFLSGLDKKLNCKVFYFSSTSILDVGIYLENDNIIYSNPKHKEIICSTGELKIFGKHNYENVMAAIWISIAAGVPIDDIRVAIKNFSGVEHRIEYVNTINGVKYYNDSKGTNPEASMKAVDSMQGPTILIAGGFDKGSSYDEWIDSFGDKVKLLVLLGETKDKIAKAAKEKDFNNIIMVDTLEEEIGRASCRERV